MYSLQWAKQAPGDWMFPRNQNCTWLCTASNTWNNEWAAHRLYINYIQPVVQATQNTYLSKYSSMMYMHLSMCITAYLSYWMVNITSCTWNMYSLPYKPKVPCISTMAMFKQLQAVHTHVQPTVSWRTWGRIIPRNQSVHKHVQLQTLGTMCGLHTNCT